MTTVKHIPVMENGPIVEGIYRLKLYSPDLCKRAAPGQFFHIKCGRDSFPFLRRPLSLSYRVEDGDCIVLVYRIQGRGTEVLASRKPGELLDVLGPLGNGFDIRDGYSNVVIIGGGIGIAPLVELASVYKNKATVMAGFKEEIFLIEELKEKSVNVRIATEDGRAGHKGFITDVLAKHLEDQQPDIVFACGPRAMLKKVTMLCKDKFIKCQVSLEERMACGIGACFGCSCATRDKDGTKKYSRVCKEGPVFRGEEVCWDE